MNRKNWLSAFTAVLMLVSMMTCFILPASAAADTGLTLPDGAVNIQEAAADDNVRRCFCRNADI